MITKNLMKKRLRYSFWNFWSELFCRTGSSLSKLSSAFAITHFSLRQLVTAIYTAGTPKARKLIRSMQGEKRNSKKLSDLLPRIHEALQQSWAWICNEICSYQWAKNNKRPVSSRWLVVSSVLQILDVSDCNVGIFSVVFRDRVSALWGTVRDHLSNILVNATQHR